MGLVVVLFVAMCGVISLNGGTASAADPYRLFPESKQVVMVTVNKATDTVGTLAAYDRNGVDDWTEVVAPTKAYVGEKGVGRPEDNVPRTPEGMFAFDQAFGRQANPGTKMPYFQATQQDWWDSNPQSKTYNTHVKQAQSPGGDSENLYDSGPVYDYAVNIAHNPQRRPGLASAIFLHVTDGKPTQGCIAVDKGVMVKILKWLDPAKQPIIYVRVVG